MKHTDIEYFKRKLEATTDIYAREKIGKQIKLMEDAVVVYHEHRLGSTTTDGEIA